MPGLSISGGPYRRCFPFPIVALGPIYTIELTQTPIEPSTLDGDRLRCISRTDRAPSWRRRSSNRKTVGGEFIRRTGVFSATQCGIPNPDWFGAPVGVVRKPASRNPIIRNHSGPPRIAIRSPAEWAILVLDIKGQRRPQSAISFVVVGDIRVYLLNPQARRCRASGSPFPTSQEY